MFGNVSHATAEMNNTNQFLVQCPISAHCLYYTLKIWHCENMIATVFHNCRSFHEKVVTIILLTFFIGIHTHTHTHIIRICLALPCIGWGNGKLGSMCRELNSTNSMGSDQDSNPQPFKCKAQTLTTTPCCYATPNCESVWGIPISFTIATKLRCTIG